MNAAPATTLSAHESVARDLMVRLLDETERARATVLAGDTDAIGIVLAARGELLEALERSVKVIAAASHRDMAPSARQTLVRLGTELAQASATLIDGLRAERDVVAAAIAAADRPDTVRARYAESAPSDTHRLNLIR